MNSSNFSFMFLLSVSAVICSAVEQADIKRSDFPNGFLFGAATSAYQIEGAFLEDGKSLSNWDVFCQIKGSISDGNNGDVADDHYHHYMGDIEIMHSLGLTAYRFSISWSRILPKGKLGAVNQAGIMFYNKIIDNLRLRGIDPLVTIHHDDYPQELLDRFGGWLSPLMQEEFVHFAEICFENFSDRVTYWVTINEPDINAEMAYMKGTYPPGHCSPPFGNCTGGNSDVEPLIAVHNMLLAHAKAAKLYREQFKSSVEGMIGITLAAFWYTPLRDEDDDKEAARRALAFNVAWALDPLIFGDYPSEMKRFHGSVLPAFSSEERLLLRESIDFIGVNHYGTLYAKDCLHSGCLCIGSSCSAGSDRAIRGFVLTTGERNGVKIGEQTGMPRFFVVPNGIEGIILYLKDRYHNKPMIVTENGYSSPTNEDGDSVQDTKRVEYHQSYLSYVAQAIRIKFGLYRIDHPTLDRVPKLSAHWYRDFLSNSSMTDEGNLQSIKAKPLTLHPK